jgi:hypothetical protein
MKVLHPPKPGLDEKAYENSLAIGPRKRGHRVEQQKRRADLRWNANCSLIDPCQSV